MSKTVIAEIHPTEGAHRLTLFGPTSLKVYESSVGDLVSITMYPTEEQRGYVQAGTRLTPHQILDLHDSLTGYLKDKGLLSSSDAYMDGWHDGDMNGFVAGYESGHDAGREEVA